MGKAAKNPVAPIMRSALLAGLRVKARKERKTLSQVCADWWDEDWQAAAKILALFQEREIAATVDIKHQFVNTLVQFANEYEAEITGEPVSCLEDMEREPGQLCN